MSNLAAFWKRKHRAQRQRPKPFQPINIFTAVGRELDQMGELLDSPRMTQGYDPMGQYTYRMQLLGRVLAITGPEGAHMHDAAFNYPIALNAAGVAVGTYRNDERTFTATMVNESEERYRERIQEIAMDWLAKHGDPFTHHCEECTQ